MFLLLFCSYSLPMSLTFSCILFAFTPLKESFAYIKIMQSFHFSGDFFPPSFFQSLSLLLSPSFALPPSLYLLPPRGGRGVTVPKVSKRASDCLERELLVVVSVSHQIWMLGTELQSSGRVADALTQRVTFPASLHLCYCFLLCPCWMSSIWILSSHPRIVYFLQELALHCHWMFKSRLIPAFSLDAPVTNTWLPCSR